MRKKYDIQYVSYGIANRFSNNYIEMHIKLLEPQYLELHNEILDHEKNHTDKGYDIGDFHLDIKGFKNKWIYRKFILTTPSSWVQFSPLYLSKKGWSFDKGLFLFYSFFIILGVLLFIWSGYLRFILNYFMNYG